MILVGAALEAFTPDFLEPSQDRKLTQLKWLLDHPALVAAAHDFKASPLIEIKDPDPSTKVVCVLQKEFATATPELVELIGTDDATTCVGLGIRNPKSGLTSIAHLDFVDCVKDGVAQMLATIFSDSDTVLEVHMVGAYDDAADMDCIKEGHSWPLCTELVETLRSSPYKLQIKTLCILRHNTIRNERGCFYPAVRGMVMQTTTGLCLPAYFSIDARGPDGIVRELSMMFAGEPSTLRSPYDTKSDSFSIKPFKWSKRLRDFAAHELTLSDADLLQSRSTSPLAESPDFVTSIRRLDTYICNHSNWEDTFPRNQSRRFVRNSATGEWTRV